MSTRTIGPILPETRAASRGLASTGTMATAASLFATVGLTAENRHGGGSPLGVPYVEALNTRRIDGGLVGRVLFRQRYLLSVRVAAMEQRHDHQFGEIRERDRHQTEFGEVTLRATAGRNTLVGGLALERDVYRPLDVPRFAYPSPFPGSSYRTTSTSHDGCR